MIYSEIYGTYYNVLSKLISRAIEGNLSTKELMSIISDNAYAESGIEILSAINEERWQILRKNENGEYVTALQNTPLMPLSNTQKSWLKAVSMDPRFLLFNVELPDLTDVEPLFKYEDIVVFDKYSDGDPYEDEGYKKRFGIILDCLRNKKPLFVEYHTRFNSYKRFIGVPVNLEYSEKDDKFRVILQYEDSLIPVNLGRINIADYSTKKKVFKFDKYEAVCDQELTIELLDERKSLDRALLHFAHFEKEVTKIDGRNYVMKIRYNSMDETEILIRVLSFGARLKVVSPESFVDRIKERLSWQKDLFEK